MKTQIRLATSADLPEYADLLQQTYQSTYTDDSIGLTKECFSKEIFASKNSQDYLKSHLIDSPTQKTWLTFIDTQLVAAVTCIIKNEREAELTGFYVHPKYQGKGLGTQLYKKALEFADKKDMLLDIYIHNKKTIALYKKWGWELDESKGENGYFTRHWPEWPAGLEAKCMYMRLKRLENN